MRFRFLVLIPLCWLLAPRASMAATQYIFFNNERVVEAVSHETKAGRIHVTLSSGEVVVMKASEVDWESTNRLAAGGVVLRKGKYESERAAEEEAAQERSGRPLTAADLRSFRGATRIARRAAEQIVGLQVYASRGWTDSGVNIGPAAPIAINCRGTVQVDATRVAGPGGVSEGSGPLLAAGLPFGALVARVGDGEPFVVGESVTHRPTRGGRLYLAVNDASRQDNTGAFDVELTPQTKRGSRRTGAATMNDMDSSSSAGASQSAGQGSVRMGLGRAIDKAEAVRGDR